MVSPKEVMKGSVLSYEGKPYIVKGVSEYIIFEGRKEWIGGSQINGEPICEEWLKLLGFQKTNIDSVWTNIKIDFVFDGSQIYFGGPSLHLPKRYIHQLQVLYFALTGEHLIIPKIK